MPTGRAGRPAGPAGPARPAGQPHRPGSGRVGLASLAGQAGRLAWPGQPIVWKVPTFLIKQKIQNDKMSKMAVHRPFVKLCHFWFVGFIFDIFENVGTFHSSGLFMTGMN